MIYRARTLVRVLSNPVVLRAVDREVDLCYSYMPTLGLITGSSE